MTATFPLPEGGQADRLSGAVGGQVLLGWAAPMGSVLNVVLAVLAAYLILKVGFAVLGSFARPAPEPPPPGEMRRVSLTYRCPLCGMELRVRSALSEDPVPPRHCMDEMELVVPAE